MRFGDKIKKEFSGKNVLLLQGPVGNFFHILAMKMKENQTKVFKLNFNGGDFFFYPSGVRCKCNEKELENFYESFLEEKKINAIVMYNDCRIVHAKAIEVAKRLGIEIWIFEEGYLRPYCITFEKDGVNANSSLPRDKNFYLCQYIYNKDSIKEIPGSFKFMAFDAFLYWLFAFVLAPFFNNKLHHRTLYPFEFLFWFRSLYRKYLYKITEKTINKKIYNLEKKYFLAILQVYSDTQIKYHYKKSIEYFIEEIILSFANHARAKSYLVFKHHPMDRGYKNYAKLIQKLSQKYHVEGRVLYVHDTHLPTLLKRALGCITINSTVGFSAILEGCPTKVCGDAFYDFEGLTYPKKLQFFWREAHAYKPNSALVRNFKKYLLQSNQFNGNFYKNSFLNK
ncbi:capsule biosynthesis protein [Campylobacter sp. VicNov18]|uniref:capsule polysaccharide modification protein KpsS n=1 Tax=Campylobacter bilis TaxID=2691918 RepID=UPI00130E9CD2|nr:capsule biosynthesis protein [Campylobacter bilis]MPV64072.1 capsule biosynthesis protein [Campylobacter hepaticus]MBM0637575.1 capsule biosynthesis protein [Campylobacter bilis]MCC8278301.1 capsule biosynthesis protein [Campylobacter bilis]MCC8299805.1 capsule biosynthesis protein [Campylobacter bilis]MCC8301210.1 capsule biosynthesis protein [Campylobacter bilis]